MADVGMIADPITRIFEKWWPQIEEYVGEGHSSFGDSTTRADTPWACMVKMPSYSNQERTMLTGDESSLRVAVQTEIYALSDNEAFEIEAHNQQIMRNMGFMLTSGAQHLQFQQSNIVRIISRFVIPNYTGYFLDEIDEL